MLVYFFFSRTDQQQPNNKIVMTGQTASIRFIVSRLHITVH